MSGCRVIYIGPGWWDLDVLSGKDLVQCAERSGLGGEAEEKCNNYADDWGKNRFEDVVYFV